MADTPDRPRSRSSSHVTLDDVARACGVSPITVSRALRGARNVAPELRARVQAAVDQLGYVPNVAARALASARSSHVAVLIPSLTNQLFVELLVAIAGFNDLGGSDQMLPPLTTVRTPRREIGERAAAMLLALMRGETLAQRRVDLGFELMIRQSS